jgi:hypothetical protein
MRKSNFALRLRLSLPAELRKAAATEDAATNQFVNTDEGPARHIDPEPCSATREGSRKASVGGMHRPAIELR